MNETTARRPRDSSVTRVAPVFSALEKRTDDWVAALLNLAAEGAGFKERAWAGLSLQNPRVRFADRGANRRELALQPPRRLLETLLERAQARPGQTLSKDPVVREKRERLLKRDPEVMIEALRALNLNGRDSLWCRFEGPTYPDAVIETGDAMIVVEGKRKERGPTTHTTWMPVRHQMLRHIDGAWECRRGRRVFGLFIVEGEAGGTSVPATWRTAADTTRGHDAITGS